jgi:hypothetical protein
MRESYSQSSQQRKETGAGDSQKSLVGKSGTSSLEEHGVVGGVYCIK